METVMKHQLGSRKLASIFGKLFGSGRPNPDNPMPPGPWDPYIRNAYLKTIREYGPMPDPWVGSRFNSRLSELNPQPLPPRYRFVSAIAEELVSFAQLAEQLSGVTNGDAGQKGSTSFVRSIVDDWCLTGALRFIPKPKGGVEPPPRPNWAKAELDGLDLMVLGAQFQETAENMAGSELKDVIVESAQKLFDAGIEKI